MSTTKIQIHKSDFFFFLVSVIGAKLTVGGYGNEVQIQDHNSKGHKMSL